MQYTGKSAAKHFHGLYLKLIPYPCVKTSFSSGAEPYTFKPQGWAGLASAGQVHGAREVTIEAVAARANFDTFLNSVVTVYILYTQTDWPGLLLN